MLTTVAVCSLPSSPLRKRAFRGSCTRCSLLVAERSATTARFWGLASQAWPLGLTTVRGEFVCRTLRSDCTLLGLPLGPRNRATCSLPNTSPRLHASRDSQPPAACPLPNPSQGPQDSESRNRCGLFVTERATAATKPSGRNRQTNCPFPNIPPQPQLLTVAGSQPPVHHTAQDSAVLRVSAPPDGEADAGRLLPPRPPKRWRPSSVRAHLAACVHLG